MFSAFVSVKNVIRRIIDFGLEYLAKLESLIGCSAAVINGRVTVCGGTDSTRCYSLDPTSNNWVQIPSVPTPLRMSSASVVVSNQWWITGKQLLYCFVMVKHLKVTIKSW